MNRRKLEQHLQQHGCRLVRHGGGHDVWCNSDEMLTMPVPRHREISQMIVNDVCRHFGISKPRFK